MGDALNKTLRGVVIDDSGQGLVEYGLIIAFVALACVVGLTGLAGSINTFLGQVGSDL